MRRFAQVGNDGLSGNILTKRERELGFGFGKRRRIENFAQTYHLPFRVRQLQAHAGFTGYGFDNADRGNAERTGKVFFEINDRIAAHADIRFDFVTRNHRTGIGIHDFDFDLEFRQFFFDGDAVIQQFFFGLRSGRVELGRKEQGGSRQMDTVRLRVGKVV